MWQQVRDICKALNASPLSSLILITSLSSAEHRWSCYCTHLSTSWDGFKKSVREVSSNNFM